MGKFMRGSDKNKVFLLFLLLFFTNNCAKIDPVTGEKILIEPNSKIKAENAAKDGKGLFGDISVGKKSATVFDFATSNVLWRATLKSLDFMPLASIDYSGGVLVTDWYSENANPQEKIKIMVRFLSNELRTDSVVVIAHKMNCNAQGVCSTTILNEKFNDSIKDTIINAARLIKIEDEKKKIK
jgi:hypothetical protein